VLGSCGASDQVGCLSGFDEQSRRRGHLYRLQASPKNLVYHLREAIGQRWGDRGLVEEIARSEFEAMSASLEMSSRGQSLWSEFVVAMEET